MSTADRVAVETPRGTIRAGTVVDRELEADANGCRYRLVVDVDGVRFAVDEADVGRPRRPRGAWARVAGTVPRRRARRTRRDGSIATSTLTLSGVATTRRDGFAPDRQPRDNRGSVSSPGGAGSTPAPRPYGIMAGSTGGAGELPKPMTLTNDLCEQHATIDAWWRGKSRYMNGKRFKIIENVLTVLAVIVMLVLAGYAIDAGGDPTLLPLAAIAVSAALLGAKATEVAALMGAFRDGFSASLEESRDRGEDQ